jgi:hypothetical protein
MSRKADAPPGAHYAISRLQAKPGIWCWAVAFRRRGKAYYKAFYDFRRGGSGKALAAAIKWRDAQLAKTQTLSQREFHQLVRSNNHSGVVGVQLIKPKNQPLGSWRARVKLPSGKEIMRAFAVSKYGDEGAFKLAVEARSELLGLVEDKPYLHHPTAKQSEQKRVASEALKPPGQP